MSRPAPAIVLVLLGATALVGCSSSGNKSSGPPSCSDTSASGPRLAQGCRHDGKLYESHAIMCADKTTLYNVPFAKGGASGYSNGKIRARAATTDEVARCVSG